MNLPTLRPYQEPAADRCRQEWAWGSRGVVLCLPTGAGKTAVALVLVGETLARGGRVVWLAPSSEVWEQAVRACREAGFRFAAVRAPVRSVPGAADVLVCLTSSARTPRMYWPWVPDLLVCDEVHRWTVALDDLVNHPDWACARRLCLTATPWRYDGIPLRRLADALVLGPQPRAMVQAGLLAPVDVQTLWSQARGKPWQPASAAACVDIWAQYLRGKRAVAWSPDRRWSERLGRLLAPRGCRAMALDGRTPHAERQYGLQALAAGELDLLLCVDLLIEGLDVPDLDAAWVLSATESLSRWLQLCGRLARPGTRPGAARKVVYDHGWHVQRVGHPQADRVWSLDVPPRLVGCGGPR